MLIAPGAVFSIRAPHVRYMVIARNLTDARASIIDVAKERCVTNVRSFRCCNDHPNDVERQAHVVEKGRRDHGDSIVGPLGYCVLTDAPIFSTMHQRPLHPGQHERFHCGYDDGWCQGA